MQGATGGVKETTESDDSRKKIDASTTKWMQRTAETMLV
jgi:hypothetical protein